MPTSRVPKPIPDPEIGDEGYEMWVRAAEWAPNWLANLEDPMSHFTQVQKTFNRRVDEMYATEMSNREPTEENKNFALDNAHMTARWQMTTNQPAVEVDQPVWDHLDPMEDPALDDPIAPLGAPEDWTPPEKTLSELMYEQIRDNS
jgi:hypothetical protein